MSRLTAEQWEQARAEYEVRGLSLGEIARRFGISDVAVGKRARKEHWEQGKSSELIDKKVKAIKELYEVEQKSSDLPRTFRTTLEDVVRERVETEFALARFDQALIRRGLELLQGVEEPAQWELLTRGRRNLHPDRERQGTTVNVSQQQAQQVRQLSPKEALAEIRGNGDEHITDA